MDVWIGLALVALVAGIVAGAGLARRSGSGSGPDPGFGRLEARLEVQLAELRRLADGANARDLTTEQMRAGLDGARRALEELRSRDRERQQGDNDQREIVRRLATVLAGAGATGRAGENVLAEHLGQLPPGMLETDLRIGGKVVEFAVRLPDGRRLPIDSKWSAVAELEALEAAADRDRDACVRAVEKVVALRAREVAQYLDPSLTAPVAVAAIPDAAYAVLRRAHADAFARGVVIVPYSSALPIVLFLYALVQRFGDAADVQSSLADVAAALDQMAAIVENRVAKAATMLTNGADELRSHLGKARGSIARAHATTDELPAVDRPEIEGRLSVVP